MCRLLRCARTVTATVPAIPLQRFLDTLRSSRAQPGKESSGDADDLTKPSLSRLNESAPAFRAPTTHGIRELSDYAEKWLVLFSHPTDFTTVCTKEL